MFEIDKKKFGFFVAELRKEKNFTQKELAEKLFLSDKAVSKWETGNSLPDTALLIPLSELLGVSVTELLMSEKIPQTNVLEAKKVEDIVKTAITYADERPERAYQVKSKWIVFYGVSFLTGCIGLFLNYRTIQPCLESLEVFMLLCAVLGAYFCCFVKTKLPGFYDENKVNIFYDGAFRMNIPGICFNNKNWSYIIKAVRISMCLFLIFLPVVNFLMGSAVEDFWTDTGDYVLLVLLFSGLFVPMYLVGKKYE